ncbi:MAG: hypothetical protein GF417_01260 [Candidatus Latescibacteria bacterium]|nr:hypothetical protein [bacterium]MBD3423056.1 hypothetical protein [Candidatus Latescibacterota bacterium]
MPRSIACLLILMLLLPSGCGNDRSEGPLRPSNPPVSLLRMSILDVVVYANLMPMVPPDPVICEVTLAVENRSSGYPFSGLSVPSGYMYRSSDNSFLGFFRFSSAWDGRVGPSSIDTFTVRKRQEDAAIFSPPCGEDVYLYIFLSDGRYSGLADRSTGINFQCVY